VLKLVGRTIPEPQGEWDGELCRQKIIPKAPLPAGGQKDVTWQVRTGDAQRRQEGVMEDTLPDIVRETEYKDHPVLEFYLGDCHGQSLFFSLGIKKLKVIDENIDRVRQFIDKHEKNCPSRGGGNPG
jgi:hypothetical protein